MLRLVLGAATVALMAASALADVARVMIALPAESDALVSEALIRIRGELSAVGLSVELRAGAEREHSPEFGAADFGVLVLERHGEQIEIRAFAPGLDSPVIQSADTSQPGVTAEVVAIRAVEALRAAMVQYARLKHERHEAVPAPVSGFTKLPPAPDERPSEAKASEPRAEAAAAVPSPVAKAPAELEWSVWLGGNFVVDYPAAADSWGGQGAVFVGYDWFRAGASVDRTWVAAEVDDPTGQSWMRRTAFAGRLRAALTAAESWELFLGLGAGVAEYSFDSLAEPGYSSSDAEHTSPLFVGEAGAAFWFLRYAGAYAGLRADLASDAPHLRFAGREVAVLERPALSASVGLMVGRF